MTERLPALRLLLADDEPARRAALSALLALEEGLTVIAEADSAPAAVALAAIRRPDIAVLAFRSAGLALSPLPACPTVIMTTHARPGDLRRALRAGARAYLPRSVSATDLAHAIRTVHRGGRYLDPDTLAPDTTVLTAEELDALDLTATGAPVPPQAARHLASAATKLGTTQPGTALRRARRHGWI
ncbi:response regulator transcription factor [Kitasatospora putterlickiae]|uniref:Response regulator transcription factor n=1 Tax=Kitasatospora putterlickiae TaxID=221725 RepID=A0ABN1YGI1_9ACTN